MQVLDGRTVFSATDLNNYLECGCLVALSREVAHGVRAAPERDETVAFIAEQGIAHEREYLEGLRRSHPALVEIADGERGMAGIEAASAATEAAMRSGAPVIYQATFFDGTFLGKADFLERVETPSVLGAWSYEAVDTKLALHDKPYFILQLCHYSEHLARVQQAQPRRMHVIFGDGSRGTYRVDDYTAYYRHLKASFLAGGAAADPYPVRCAHCAICDWETVCDARWRRDDHLGLVYGMRVRDEKLLTPAGVATVAQLAQAPQRPAGMQPPTFERLQRQARLQMQARADRGYHYELLAHTALEGFGLLPAPDPGDVFFDMEGDPFFEIGRGLEYLFGFYCPDDVPAFRAFWGTDRAAEKRAFEQSVDFIVARRRRFPALHVYHYAPYETTRLRSLAARHGTREEEVDRLLRGEVLVDLFAVVRAALAVSQERYSIKKLEPFYGMERAADIRRGDDSILEFERWRRTPERRDILERIEAYNEEDCRSTWLLREWLLQRREEYLAWRDDATAFRAERDPDRACHAEPVEGCRECAKRERDAREAKATSEVERRLLERSDAPSVLLGHLLSYHRREAKPEWWNLFDRSKKIGSLTEFDHEAIGALRLDRSVAAYKLGPRDRNLVYTYTFPEQEYKLGNDAVDPATLKTAGEIVRIDPERNVLLLKRAGDADAAQTVTALIPAGPRETTVQRGALVRIGSAELDGSLATRHPSVLDILGRKLPRLRDRPPGARVQPAVVDVESVCAVVRALDGSYLVVQGPPGTGKTYTGARVIANLLREGKRVGVMASGHKAIHNMLHEIERVLHAEPAPFGVAMFHKHSKLNEGSPFVSALAVPLVVSDDDNEAAESGRHQLVAGNSWLFARPGLMGAFDYLFVDEAGQTSLADAIAVAPSATNIVFLGDPMQLAHVMQGTHGEAGERGGVSVLEHLVGGATVAPERGILLDVTYRMQPEIAAFISDAMYDGRLRADARTADNRIRTTRFAGGGLAFLPVVHDGNGNASTEEARAIVMALTAFLTGTVHVGAAPERALTEHDVLVVTPFNAQRKRVQHELERAGFPGVRVGTVDKFQGQEAPVVFYSMAASSGEDVPRGVDFLFERHRFNVAVSRAQCAVILVCSPRLLDTRCSSAEQMALVNLVCAFVEQARRI